MANTSSYDIVDGNRVDNPTDNTTYVFSATATLKTFTLAGNSDGDTVAIDATSSDFKVKFKKNEMTLIGQKNTPSAGVIVKIQIDTSNGGVNHLAFLDGTVDVSFVPNAPGELKGKWTFGGNEGVKKLNLGGVGVSYDIDSSHTYAQAQVAANAALNSQTLILTQDEDHIVLDAIDTMDTVRGVVDFDMTSFGWGWGEDGFDYSIGGVDNSTFNVGDTIEGNGNTKVELTLDVSSSLLGEDMWFFGEDGVYVDAEYVEMSGVDELALKAGSSYGAVGFDASSYGNDISKVSLSGRDGMYADVYDLQADDTLNVALQTGGDLDVSGTWNGLDFDVELDNSDDSTESSVNLTAAAVSVIAGNDATADLDLNLSSSGDGPVESVGAIVVGNVTLAAGTDGEVDFSVSGYANNYSEGDALVGDVTVGNIGITLAKSATNTDVTIEQYANAEDGSATVGNMKVGNVTLNAAENADFEDINVYQYAYADSGDATIGTRNVGNIAITLGSGAEGDNQVDISASATVSGSGDVTIGNGVIGNITINGGDGVEDQDAYVYAWAYADTGNATIGNTQVGNVSMTFGDGDGEDNWYSFSAMVSATVDETGDATVGNVTIGNITQTAGDPELNGDGDAIDSDDQQLWAYSYQLAQSDKGNATVGNNTVGNITQTVGDDGDAALTVDQYATAVSGDATMGNVTVGNIALTAGARGDLDAFVRQEGDATTGDVTIGTMKVGNIDMSVGVDGSAYFEIDRSADVFGSSDATASIGSTTVGNVNLYAGGSGYAGFGLTVDAYNTDDSDRADTTVGNVTVGNVTIAVENDAAASFWNGVYAGAVGNITYGNVNVEVGENSDLNWMYISASASTADVGNFTVGDLTVNLAKSASLTNDGGFEAYAFESIGNVTLGDQTITVATEADFGDEYSFENYFYAENGSIGAVKIGDITLTGVGADADISIDTDLWAEDSIKSVTMGNASVSADGDDSDSDYEVDIRTDGTIGNVTGGNLSAVAAGEDADAEVDIEMWAYNDIGDVKFGNVVVSAENDHAPDVVWGEASATVDISITGSSDLGDVTVGSVTMTAIGEDADTDFDLEIGNSYETSATVDIENIGDIKVGNLVLMASGSSADVDVDIYANTDTGVIGTMTLGNIDILVANTEEADTAAKVSVTVDAYGDLTVGDITLEQGDMTDWGTNETGDGDNDADMFAYVDLDSWNGDLIVGDITVTGGYLTESDDSNDNYDYVGVDNSGWLELYADGTITVGDIDYSGYERAATIEVDTWLGAANIKASQGGSTITDNATKNTITLGDGADTVILLNGNSGLTAADADVIIDFDSAEDLIDLNLSGSEFEVDSSGTTFADFLSDAQGADKDIYAAKVGSDYYVAIDTDGGDAVDFVIKLVGVSNVSSSDFT